MRDKVKRSGRSNHFEVSFLNGRWERIQVHGHDVWVDAKGDYERHSPRAWALSWALRVMWGQNRGTMFTWRETVGNLRHYIRGVGRITRDDLGHAKAILRECGRMHVEEDGELFVYVCTRGKDAKMGFAADAADAVEYEAKAHRELKVREGRIAAGTVESAGDEFAVPVRTRSMRTRVLDGN